MQVVKQLIPAKASHPEKTNVPDAEWFLDANLAILAAQLETFSKYVQAIREEYSQFSDAEFRTGRLRFLKTILDAPILYRTAVLRERFEASARRNLQNELATLLSDSL